MRLRRSLRCSKMRHTGGVRLEGPAYLAGPPCFRRPPGESKRASADRTGRKRPPALSDRGRNVRGSAEAFGRGRARRDRAGPSGAIATGSSRGEFDPLTLSAIEYTAAFDSRKGKKALGEEGPIKNNHELLGGVIFYGLSVSEVIGIRNRRFFYRFSKK